MNDTVAEKEIIEGEFTDENMPMTQIVKREETNILAPAGSIDELLGRYNLQGEFIKKVLKEGKDYGVIPGTDKLTLLKPGAEKITTLFGLSSEFPRELQMREEDWTGEHHGGEPFFFYEDTCRLTKDGVLIAEAAGSCNSWEKKYRYRSPELKCPVCGKEGTVIKGKEEYGGGWLCWAKKGGCGQKFVDTDPAITNQDMTPIKNPFIFDQVNTIKKMTQKRAYVAATLMAGNVSDYFTQDVEDSDEIGGTVGSSSAPKENVAPADVRVTYPKAKELFGGQAPTIAELFAKDPEYCNWVYSNREDEIGTAMRTFLDGAAAVERVAKEPGRAAIFQRQEAVKNVKIILAQTSGKLTPNHYWPNVRKMGLDENTAANLASQYGEEENGWRKALEEAVKVVEDEQ